MSRSVAQAFQSRQGGILATFPPSRRANMSRRRAAKTEAPLPPSFHFGVTSRRDGGQSPDRGQPGTRDRNVP